MLFIRVKHIWTPLEIFGIKFYRDIDTKVWYIKKGKQQRLQRLR